MPSRSSDFVAFDLETTGLDAIRDEIIEIAAVRFVEGQPTERFNCFVRPQRPVPAFIKQLTGITDADLAKGLNLPDALHELDAFLGESLVVGHNVIFDIGFHDESRIRCSLTPRFYRTVDTLALARIYEPFLDNHRLETLTEAHGIAIERAHRAIHDAEATGKLLIALAEHITEHIALDVNMRVLELIRTAGDETDLPMLLEEIIDYQRRYALLKKQPARHAFAPANAVEHEVPSGKQYTMEQIFGQLFANAFPGYEYRPGQVEMAGAVEQALHTGECLTVEAGTGVGKSLAYLAPAIQFAERNHTKVVVSTNTKNLQEQLFHKDLPAFRDAVDIPFLAVLLKGRENYLCPQKWHELLSNLKRVSGWEARGLLSLVIWAEQTNTGDISENSSFSRKHYSALWKRLAADRHFCSGKRCPRHKECWLMDVRKRAEDAHIIIVNHSLLLADVSGGNTTLGEYDHLIIDEAHNLPDAASQHLGVSLSWADVSVFVAQLSTSRSQWQVGILPQLKAAVTKSGIGVAEKETLHKNIENLEHYLQEHDEAKTLFAEVGTVCERSGNYGKLRLKEPDEHAFLAPGLQSLVEFFVTLEQRLGSLRDVLNTLSEQRFAGLEAHIERINGARQRCGEFLDALETFCEPDFENRAYWFSSFQAADPDTPNGMLNAAPLNIDDILDDQLFSRVSSLVCTSATLALRGSFKYFTHRVGLDRRDNLRELVVPSPFDYSEQCRVVAAGFLPDPKDEKFFHAQALSLLKDLIIRTRVGCMVLFTSHRDLQYAADYLAQPLYEQDIPLLVQRDNAGRTALLNQFRNHGSAVLLGTSSFWEGVDVRGEALSLLVLYKLPFQVPSEPIVEAHCERLQRQGLPSFMHYQLPTALLRFRQGMGRLIRSRVDRGVVLILDNRVLTKNYGRYFEEITPTNIRRASQPIELLDHVAAFFRSV